MASWMGFGPVQDALCLMIRRRSSCRIDGRCGFCAENMAKIRWGAGERLYSGAQTWAPAWPALVHSRPLLICWSMKHSRLVKSGVVNV